jgi:hypothetical protein
MILNPLDLFLQSINSIAPWFGQCSKQRYSNTTFLTAKPRCADKAKCAQEMEHLSSEMEQQNQHQVQWRRDKVQELCSKGYSQLGINIDTNRQSKKIVIAVLLNF